MWLATACLTGLGRAGTAFGALARVRGVLARLGGAARAAGVAARAGVPARAGGVPPRLRVPARAAGVPARPGVGAWVGGVLARPGVPARAERRAALRVAPHTYLHYTVYTSTNKVVHAYVHAMRMCMRWPMRTTHACDAYDACMRDQIMYPTLLRARARARRAHARDAAALGTLVELRPREGARRERRRARRAHEQRRLAGRHITSFWRPIDALLYLLDLVYYSSLGTLRLTAV